MNYTYKLKALVIIIQDMKEDAENFEGKRFSEQNTSDYVISLGVAISMLASIVKLILEDSEEK